MQERLQEVDATFIAAGAARLAARRLLDHPLIIQTIRS